MLGVAEPIRVSGPCGAKNECETEKMEAAPQAKKGQVWNGKMGLHCGFTFLHRRCAILDTVAAFKLRMMATIRVCFHPPHSTAQVDMEAHPRSHSCTFLPARLLKKTRRSQMACFQAVTPPPPPFRKPSWLQYFMPHPPTLISSVLKGRCDATLTLLSQT